MRALLLIALLASCGANRQVFVQRLAIDGRWLIVTKCALEYSGDEVQRDDAACETEKLALPPPATEAR